MPRFVMLLGLAATQLLGGVEGMQCQKYHGHDFCKGNEGCCGAGNGCFAYNNQISVCVFTCPATWGCSRGHTCQEYQNYLLCKGNEGCCPSGTKCQAYSNQVSVCMASCPSGWACGNTMPQPAPQPKPQPAPGGKQYDWSKYPVPAEAGQGRRWELQEDVSDEFNYAFNAVSQRSNFGNNKWYNFYHNNWDGPGTTYWKHDHVAVSGGDLVLRASRNPSKAKMGVEGISAGCITSTKRVVYPVFVEARVSVANIALASDVWLLSPDDTQEIDVIECYGGAGHGNAYFAEKIHLSHHSFIRNPFTDYQPRDSGSWYSEAGVKSWGDYCWNNGNRRYVRVGVYWRGPSHFEYFIDGELVRVLYKKAFATKLGNTWHYAFPTNVNAPVHPTKTHSTSGRYSFDALERASRASPFNVIDPHKYQGGKDFTKPQDIIINVESQNWHVEAGRTPSTADLRDPKKNKMLVDWVRVYKPRG